jgi:hypothetical protein
VKYYCNRCKSELYDPSGINPFYDIPCPRCSSFLIPIPSFETPEQYEERTGKAWPDNGAVYFRRGRPGDDVEWGVCRWVSARRDHDICAVATEAGPPHDGWMPDEKKG